ncbi:MAG: DUF3014 domain-containing protein [Pseudomonadota bacterium]|nr:DUF3014 domain-containing protein [Pseudomonadota bacterium]
MTNKAMIGVAVGVLALASGAWYVLHTRHAVPRNPPTAAQPVAPEPAPEDQVANPVIPGTMDAASSTALPTLNDSDAALNEALTRVLGTAAISDFLLPESIIRHLVVTIDNLPRQKVSVQKLPTRAVPGSFAVIGDELHATLDPRNFARYEPMVAVVRKVDMKALATVYFRFYPLFQQSYQDLGYPKGYFNDRLVKVIDLLLGTAPPAGPVELVRPNVMYLYADPALESLSAGQKLLIRMGPENAAAVKAKLAELRAVIAAAPPKR